MMMNYSFLLTLLSLALTLSFNNALDDEYCFLCPSGQYPVKPNLLLDANGRTCQTLDAQMFNPSNYGPGQRDGRCSALQSQYRNCCCNAGSNCAQPRQNPRPAPTPPQNNLPMGNEPACSLCPNYKFPGKPYTITTVQYIPGNPTCQDLHFMGQAKQIPGALCYPLQLYMRVPCGCNL
jgi:hypothetical protein